MICWVRSARSAEASVGRASASSRALVWSDCVPPSTAASAWSVTRTKLTSGCSAVSVEPAVCVWKRNIQERGLEALKRSRMMRAQSRRAARNFATSSKRSLCAARKNERRGANSSTARPRARAASTYAMAFESVNATSWTAVEPASRMW